VFITACGASHIVHAFHAVSEQTPFNTFKLGVLIFTASVSLATAIGFTFLMPRIMTLTSPAAARERLEGAIASATADLEAALSHEKLLLREIHHRVKNNLQVTASLVNLHIRRSKLEDTSEFHALRDRITAMADVHTQLQEVGARPLSVKQFVESLCEKLRISHGRPYVATRVEGGDFEVSLDHAASLALILNEVLSNAYRHAFGPDSVGTITVDMSDGPDAKTILISDDGSGRAPDAGVQGIGTVLVTSLAVQLGATFAWSDRPEGGTAFLLTIAKAS
jgi:two-component sensor histidine kinase